MLFRIFISGVQSEFAKERKALAEYIRRDSILGRFFEVLKDLLAKNLGLSITGDSDSEELREVRRAIADYVVNGVERV